MELRHLRYFVAVVEEQSFTKAAEKLFIAQPPLSRQIQNLEQELGIQLFESGSRPLKTTEAGQFFYQHAVKLLSNAEEIKSMTKRVGMHGSYRDYWLCWFFIVRIIIKNCVFV